MRLEQQGKSKDSPVVDSMPTPPRTVPDLSMLRAQAELFAINAALGGGGSSDPSSRALQANSIRLVDAAVRDYLLGAASIAQFHDRKANQFGLTPLLLSTTHFESCIWHLERFIKHIRALRSCPKAEPELKQLVPKTSVFLQGAVEGKLTRLRHTLAHLEKRASSGKIPKGKSLVLLPVELGLVIGDHSLSWDELSLWLKAAHDCSCRLAVFRPVRQMGDAVA